MKYRNVHPRGATLRINVAGRDYEVAAGECIDVPDRLAFAVDRMGAALEKLGPSEPPADLPPRGSMMTEILTTLREHGYTEGQVEQALRILERESDASLAAGLRNLKAGKVPPPPAEPEPEPEPEGPPEAPQAPEGESDGPDAHEGSEPASEGQPEATGEAPEAEPTAPAEGDSPTMCPHCDKTFSTTKGLKAHVAMKHAADQ